MTFYNELQLNQAGSKNLINNSKCLKEKIRHIAIYLFKIFITMFFCVAFVIAFSKFLGIDNSIVGVVVLLFVLVFRNSDLGFYTKHAIPTLSFIFLILAIGPRLSNISSLPIGFLIHTISIFLLMFLGCHNIMMFNQSTLVLGYLLLYGYDVSGVAYIKRLIGLFIGALMTILIYYRNHREKTYEDKIIDVFKNFNIDSDKTKWQLSLTLAVSSILFLGNLINLPRPMWAGIAAMSIIIPFSKEQKKRAKSRILGNIIGSILVIIIYTYCPNVIYDNIGILGGICVGLSATYGFQSIFNTFGAISIAASILGFPAAIFYRIFNNILGSVYGLFFNKFFCKSIKSISN